MKLSNYLRMKEIVSTKFNKKHNNQMKCKKIMEIKYSNNKSNLKMKNKKQIN